MSIVVQPQSVRRWTWFNHVLRYTQDTFDTYGHTVTHHVRRSASNGFGSYLALFYGEVGATDVERQYFMNHERRMRESGARKR